MHRQSESGAAPAPKVAGAGVIARDRYNAIMRRPWQHSMKEVAGFGVIVACIILVIVQTPYNGAVALWALGLYGLAYGLSAEREARKKAFSSRFTVRAVGTCFGEFVNDPTVKARRHQQWGRIAIIAASLLSLAAAAARSLGWVGPLDMDPAGHLAGTMATSNWPAFILVLALSTLIGWRTGRF
jgi:hypothetical protein